MEIDAELPPALEAAVQRLDQLVARFEQHPDPVVQDCVFELLRCVDGVHRSGVRALAELLRKAGLLRRALDDPEVKLLFDIYEVGEGGEQIRAEAVLTPIRQSLDSRGGQLEVVSADAGRITIRLTGSFAGDHATAFQKLIDDTLRDNLPGYVGAEVQFTEAARPRTFVPAAQLRMAVSRFTWRTVALAKDIPAGGTLPVELEGRQLLLASMDDRLYAYDNACPGTPFPLDAGHVEAGVLHCPFHGCRFDLRTGKRLDREGAGLGLVPVRMQDGQVLVAPAGAAA